MKDYFGKSCDALKNKKLFLFDQDGTLYNADRLFVGAKEMVAYANKVGKAVFVTNNSSKSVADYVNKLKNMGIDCSSSDFYTSTDATIAYLKANHFGAKVYCVGTDSLCSQLRQGGICLVEKEDADLLLVGYDTQLTYQKLIDASWLLTKDVPFVATNCDLVCPIDFGFVPDCGSFCQMLTIATGKKPTYVGKPSKEMANFAMEKFGYTKDETLILGDRLYTDIACGANAGIETVCFLSGEATLGDIADYPTKPTYVFQDVAQLVKLLTE
ncbi:MAG: HAD-IIA family hydrolase [Clostridia bacterium]|nr:HAD-IIA family hydrolase [Clostridia bacterium]